MIDLSVITVTHNSAEFIEDQITSVISGALTISTEHFIVDNASCDQTVELIEKHYLSYVTLLKNRQNLGFSAANNQAYPLTKGRYILFLNPDMKVEDGSLDKLVQWMDAHHQVGIVTCKLIDSWGRLLIHRGPRSLPRLGSHILWLVFPQIRREKQFANYSEVKEVAAILGAFMLTRRSFLDRLGFAFDPRYFLTFEDIDLCHEARRLGYKIHYYPFVSCIDYNSRSFLKKPRLWTYTQVARGMRTYFQKWGSWYSSLLITLLTPVGYLLRYFMFRKNR